MSKKLNDLLLKKEELETKLDEVEKLISEQLSSTLFKCKHCRLAYEAQELQVFYKETYHAYDDRFSRSNYHWYCESEHFNKFDEKENRDLIKFITFKEKL